MNSEALSRARQHIQNNQLFKAAQILLNHLEDIHSAYTDELIIYMADIKAMERTQRMGVESPDNIRREVNRITHSILQLLQEIEKEPARETSVSTSLTKHKNNIVYISYAWEDETEKIVEMFEGAARQASLETVRDTVNGVLYKGNIKEFMTLLGSSKCIVVIISDKYLKSQNCMYEMLQIKENKNLAERVFPIVLPNANLYDPVTRVEYVKYWQEKWKVLNDSLKSLDDFSSIENSQKDLRLYSDIKNVINEITEVFSNTNALTADIHVKENFKSIIDSIFRNT